MGDWRDALGWMYPFAGPSLTFFPDQDMSDVNDPYELGEWAQKRLYHTLVGEPMARADWVNQNVVQPVVQPTSEFFRGLVGMPSSPSPTKKASMAGRAAGPGLGKVSQVPAAMRLAALIHNNATIKDVNAQSAAHRKEWSPGKLNEMQNKYNQEIFSIMNRFGRENGLSPDQLANLFSLAEGGKYNLEDATKLEGGQSPDLTWLMRANARYPDGYLSQFIGT